MYRKKRKRFRRCPVGGGREGWIDGFAQLVLVPWGGGGDDQRSMRGDAGIPVVGGEGIIIERTPL
jgi:hypothetical protein